MNLSDELRLCVEDLTRLIEGVKEHAAEVDIDPYRMVTPTGTPSLAPLLAAKADCLSALARHPEEDA